MKTFALAIALFAIGGESTNESWKKEFTLKDLESTDLKSVWQDWKTAFGRGYVAIDEEAERYGIWIDNLNKIAKHNSNPSTSWTMRLNQFGDLTSDEFRIKVHGHKGSCLNKAPTFAKSFPTTKTLLKGNLKNKGDNPDSIDWTDYNGKSYVTPVKNQGDCGSCWAFSTTGSIECRYAIANDGTLNSLSEQQLMDCSYSEGNLGCDGGEMDDAFKYVVSEGGLCSEDEYPYKGEDGTCKASDCSTLYNKISSYSDVEHKNEDDLETAVASGCVSVAIEADQFAFQFYSGGVLDGTCGTSLDHGVLVVGYGTDGSQQYWKVKNSWGSTWGENGYVLICKDCDKNGEQGECGILDDPSYPVV